MQRSVDSLITPEQPDGVSHRRARSIATPRLTVATIALALTLLALLPRAWGLADFYTIDEGYHWLNRVAAFSAALAKGHWAATNLTGHPGVTTMWLGSLGRQLAFFLGVPDPGWAGGGASYLGLVRLPLAVANSLAVGVAYLLLRRLAGGPLALLAALLWALDPFLIAHGRLLHLDALLASFCTLSLLALLAATRRQPRDARHETPDTSHETPDARHQARATSHQTPDTSHGRQVSDLSSRALCLMSAGLGLGSGLLAGLALLTKAPSLLLLPCAGLLLFALAPSSGLLPRLRWAVPRYAAWLLAALLTVAALWPAMWAAPLAAAGRVLNEIVANGGQPHHSGNFFWGQAVGAPGPLFYGAVLLWRSTPWLLAGLCLLPLALRRWPTTRPLLLALLLWVALFTLALSIEPKKFDRYLLPIFPALNILAAAGLLTLGERLLGQHARRMLPAVVAVPALLTLAAYHPYYLAYFNPLLGGGRTAQQVLLVGWGEGLEDVGAWLRSRPDLDRGPVLSWTPPNLAPFVPLEIPVLDLRPDYVAKGGNYAVLYVRSVQRQEQPAAEAYARQSPPLYTLQRYGITYATVHQLPRPYTVAREARFGDALHLRGFSAQQLGATLTITPSWSTLHDSPADRWLFLHLLDAEGQRVAALDTPVDGGLFAHWQAGQQFSDPLTLQLPPDLPAGRYQAVIGVYTPASGERLPIAIATPLPPERDGPNALLLGEFDLP